MYATYQQEILQAMGFVLYQTVPVTAVCQAVAATDNSFWQSAFGRNVAYCSDGVNPHSLNLAVDARTREAKKDLWRQLKALRKLG